MTENVWPANYLLTIMVFDWSYEGFDLKIADGQLL